MSLLTSNSELRPHHIWNWSIPALRATLLDGSHVNTCPSAGACARVCYARNGTYLFSNVLAAHTRNLQMTLDSTWPAVMIAELQHRRYRPKGTARIMPLPLHELDFWCWHWADAGGAAVRIHDSGDFYTADYLDDWLTIARATPDVLFYAYTKEIVMMRAAADRAPENFRWLYSTGGTQDHLIDPDLDRHADVFPDEQAIADAGYTSQDVSDLLAILLPTTRIGIPANNIKHFNRLIAGRRFSEMQPHRQMPR